MSTLISPFVEHVLHGTSQELPHRADPGPAIIAAGAPASDPIPG